jgi:hypothetical protein
VGRSIPGQPPFYPRATTSTRGSTPERIASTCPVVGSLPEFFILTKEQLSTSVRIVDTVSIQLRIVND